MPYAARRGLGKVIGSVPAKQWDKLGAMYNTLRPATARISLVGDKAHKLAARLDGVKSVHDLYLSLVSEWQDSSIVPSAPPGPIRGAALEDPAPFASFEAAELMMYMDSVSYLPDDILCKVDRAAMSVSLETRVPFLDHRIVETAWRLPLNMKIRNGQGKWALREVLYQRVPRKLLERPKAGFAVPVGDWLRGPLRDWAENLLNPARLKAEGYIDAELVQARWQEHLSGRHDWTPRLWSVLMFQAWLDAN
jgi:asparagine synthase (glutamine-hydrolysing)